MVLQFLQAGKAAASIAGRVMGQNAAVAGDDPEQVGSLEDVAWSDQQMSCCSFAVLLGRWM